MIDDRQQREPNGAKNYGPLHLFTYLLIYIAIAYAGTSA
jgi:hypothetical protein